MTGRKKTFLIALAIIIILAAIVIIGYDYNRNPKNHPAKVVQSSANIQLYSSQLLGRNLQFPLMANSHTLRFFTGTAFAEFDLDSLKSKSLTPEMALPQADDVLWHGNLALINLDQVTSDDNIYGAANSDARNGPSWWVVNLTTGSIKQVLSSKANYAVVGAAWASSSGNSLYILSQSGTKTNQYIEIRTLDGQSLAGDQTHDLSLAGSTLKGALIWQLGRLMTWSNGKFTDLSIQAPNPPVVLQNGRYFLYSDGANSLSNAALTQPLGNIYEYDTSSPNRLTKILADDSNTGNYAPLQNGLLILPIPSGASSGQSNPSATTQQLIVNDGSSLDTYSLQVEGSQDMLGFLSKGFLLDQSGDKFKIAVINSSNELFLLSTDQSIGQESSPYSPIFLPEEFKNLPDASLTYSVLDNQLDIFLKNASNTSAVRQAIFEQLSQLGDPNQVIKVWHPFVPQT